MPDIILTGLPRGGTTLAGALIDGMEHSACISEPLWQQDWAKQHVREGAGAFAQFLRADFQRVRSTLAAGGSLMDLREGDGSAPTNYFRTSPDDRQAVQRLSPTAFSRAGLPPDFTLAVKHNGLYLGALPEIAAAGFKIIAVIRNPVGVLASWQVTPIPLRKGLLPAGSIYWREMAQLTQAEMPLLTKQVRILDLMFERLHRLRDTITIVTYEALVENPALLSGITGKPAGKNLPPIRARKQGFYPVSIDAICDALKAHGRSYRLFYDSI